ncbi:MAG TPA: HEAT repeat domain-containing protein [Thermoanaerobaculia bacterium]|nr:HEAT repeat domain-containing protein [Thermoanaerobaculia bacterium]
MRTKTVLLAAVLSLLAALPAAGSARFVPVPGPEPRAWVEEACAKPSDPDCRKALSALAREVAAALLEASRIAGADVAPLARAAADAADPILRAAAATALGTPFADPASTPVLAELADDPVPAVRAAALHALSGSQDPRAQQLVQRLRAVDSGADERSETAEAAPPASKMGVPLPANAVFLHFGSTPAEGRYAWFTSDAPAKVLAALAAKGRGPLTAAEFREQTGAEEMEEMGDLDDGEMPSAEQMAQAMAMAERMMGAMASAAEAGGSQEEQVTAIARAATGLAAMNPELADEYEDAELFGDPRFVIVPLAGGGEAVAVVYVDRVLGGTGITVHRAALP